MSFDRPLALLTLLAVPAALGLYVLARRRASRSAVSYPNVRVLAEVTAGRPVWRAWVPTALLAAAVAALCIAVARPHVDRVVTDERATVILVLDTSRSMLSDDVRPSRLAAAKVAAQRFLDRVPRQLRVGLITFSGDVVVATVPTHEHERVRATIASIDPYTGVGSGTAIGDAIARAVEVAQDAVRTRALSSVATAAEQDELAAVSILFLSDGRQNRGILPPLEGAARATAAGIPVYTVALGTSGGGTSGPGLFAQFRRAPDPATLRAIAAATGGEFFRARTTAALSSAYTGLASRLGRTTRRSEVTVVFVAAAAAALLAAFLGAAWWAPRLP